MVWFQIIAVAVASGIWLYYIERENEPRKRRLKYVPFLLCMPLLASVLVTNAQHTVSSPDYFDRGMLELVVFFLVLAIEAIYIAKFTRTKLTRTLTRKANIFLFMPVYTLSILVASFFTLLFGGLMFAGS